MRFSQKIILQLFISIFSISIFQTTLYSQIRGEVSLLAGYQMLGNIDAYEVNGYNPATGKLDIVDAAFYSGILGINVERNVIFEVQYLYQPTRIDYDPDGPTEAYPISDASVNYILAGAMYQTNFSRSAIGYGGLLIGAAGIVPSDYYESVWRFAIGIELGVKFLLSNRVGIKLQSQGLFPFQWEDGGLFVGSSGTGFGVTAGTAIAQLNFSGGLFYTF